MKFISPYITFEAKKHRKVALIIHGYGANSEECFYPWLKRKLENLGYKVELPSLPNADRPNADEQVEYILENYPNKKDIIISHSFGTCVAMKLVEKFDYEFDSLFLVAGFIDHNFTFTDEEEIEILSQGCDWEFNFDDIKSKTNVYILRPETDSEISLEQTESLAEAFDEPIHFFKEKEDHACGEKEPEVFKFIKDIIR